MPLDYTHLENTIYKKSIKNLSDYKYNVIKPSKNKKLGSNKSAIVKKGSFKDYRMYTLTLEERATCPKTCFHWSTCFGNNMPFAHRISHFNQPLLEQKIDSDLSLYCSKQYGVLLRTHVLGDFFNIRYVLFWESMLEKYPNLALYGYTAYLPEDSNKHYSEIGLEIKRLVKKFGNRFAIRFSNSFKESFSANSTDIMKAVKGESIVCPEQTKLTDNCTTCALCWDCPSKKILFITH